MPTKPLSQQVQGAVLRHKSNRGGARPGGGRRKGSQNKRTTAAKLAAAAAAAGRKLPHELLLDIAHGLPVDINGTLVYPEMKERIEAMRAAAPYFAPRLNSVEIIQGIPDAELDAIIAGAAAEAAIGVSFGGASAPGQAAAAATAAATATASALRKSLLPAHLRGASVPGPAQASAVQEL